MGRNGDLPKILRKVHEHYRTPYVAIVCGSIVIMFFSMVNNLEFVVYSISFGFLIGFSIVNLSLIKLRRIKPHLHRPFKTPLYPLTPIIGIVTSTGLLAFFDVKSLAFGILWGLLGLIIYFLKQKSLKIKRYTIR